MLSTINGTPARWATAAMPGMSKTTLEGLAMVSPKNALVFGRTAAAHCSRSSGSSTKDTSIPSLGRL